MNLSAVQPTGPELEVLGVVWALPGGEALKLSQIHERIAQRRGAFGEPAPALTTVSSTLRNAVARGLLTEVRLIGGQVVEVERSGPRSTLHATRSPQTAYKAAHTPSEVLSPMFRVLLDAYPSERRYQALLDVAAALELKDDIIDKIRKLLPTT